jgi:hypothetical protein
VVLGVVAWHAPVARAGSFQVTTVSDDGAGSLRAALTAASAPGSHTITITAMGTIEVQAQLPSLAQAIAITGPGADKLTIHQAVLTVTVLTISAAVQLSGVTVSGGKDSGIIVGPTGSLILRNSVITGNTTPTMGAAIYASGALTIDHSTITGNTDATGTAAVYAGADTLVLDSTIADNHGAGIVFAPGTARTLTVHRSTISGNIGTTAGGLELLVGSAEITNSTFSGNTGADVWTAGNGVALTLTNVTSVGTGNLALLLDHPTGTTVTLLNTVLAGTGARCSAGSQLTSRGHNLASETSCGLTDATDRMATDPMLGPLAANGGATRTHAPLVTSPAVNAGGSLALDTVDQRGFPRVQFAAADIGAVEVTEPAISQQPVALAIAVGVPLTLSVIAQDPASATPLRFQWRKAGDPIAGATASTYTKAAAQADDSGSYDVLVINDGGSIASAAVVVTVGEGGGGDAGGCAATGASGPALLGLVLLGYRRRRRANHEHAG